MAAAILETLTAALAFESAGEPSGNVSTGRGRVDGRLVHVAIVENRVASGSIGVVEAKRLGDAFTTAARERSPLVVFLDSAGAKVSEGLRALGAFRALYRSGLGAALSGVPIAAVLGRNCYGGASMVAHLANARLFSAETRLAMSGPSIIASAAGLSAQDEMFQAMADAALGPAARAKASAANRVWGGEDVAAWLREALEPRGNPAEELRARHEALGAGLEAQASESRWEAVRRRDLERIYAEGYETFESNGVLKGTSRRNGNEEILVGIVGKQVLGATRAWQFADQAWRAHGSAARRLEVFLDCATHAARLDDERIVLSEYIVDAAFALATLAATGVEVGLTILGKAGGGVYVALAAPASRVTSVYGADIQVLPGAAVAAILGRSEERAPSFEEYRAAAVAENEIKLGFVPGTQ